VHWAHPAPASGVAVKRGASAADVAPVSADAA
jgi:hypothetical protein